MPVTKSANNAAPLVVAGFIKKFVFQNTADSVSYAVDDTQGLLSNRTTNITIIFSTTCSLLANSTLKILNLTDSPTGSTKNIALTCSPAGFISTSGVWVRETGTLKLPIEANTSANATYTCTVTLNRPQNAQPPPQLLLAVDGTTYISGVEPEVLVGTARPLGLDDLQMEQ